MSCLQIVASISSGQNQLFGCLDCGTESSASLGLADMSLQCTASLAADNELLLAGTRRPRSAAAGARHPQQPRHTTCTPGCTDCWQQLQHGSAFVQPC